MVSEWLDAGAESRVTVAINLPSGVSTDSVKVEVIVGGTKLDVEILRPSPLQNANNLFKAYITEAKLSIIHGTIQKSSPRKVNSGRYARNEELFGMKVSNRDHVLLHQ